MAIPCGRGRKGTVWGQWALSFCLDGMTISDFENMLGDSGGTVKLNFLVLTLAPNGYLWSLSPICPVGYLNSI